MNTLTPDHYDISNDRVLVRCYPGYLPTIKVQDMGGTARAREGSMTCMKPEG